MGVGGPEGVPAQGGGGIASKAPPLGHMASLELHLLYSTHGAILKHHTSPCVGATVLGLTLQVISHTCTSRTWLVQWRSWEEGRQAGRQEVFLGRGGQEPKEPHREIGASLAQDTVFAPRPTCSAQVSFVPSLISVGLI